MNDTTINILLMVGTAVISLFSRKYIEPILPERKKAISYIKKFLIFNLQYSLNVFILIYFFIELEFNKYFVLIISFFIGIILYNIINDYRNKILKIHWDTLTFLAEEIDKINGIKK
jgi:hypothetical protein